MNNSSSFTSTSLGTDNMQVNGLLSNGSIETQIDANCEVVGAK